MDDRKPPDTNVVRLRRNGDLSDEERQRLASTIFADQTKSAPSRAGTSSLPLHRHRPPATNPRRRTRSSSSSRPKRPTPSTSRGGVDERDATAEYFDRLGSQTPAEMTQSVSPHPAAAGMPGSANLPKELVTPRRRRSRPQRRITSSHRRSRSSPAGSRCSASSPRRARRAGGGRRGTGRDRRRRGARYPRRQAARQQTHERTFIPRARASDPR